MTAPKLFSWYPHSGICDHPEVPQLFTSSGSSENFLQELFETAETSHRLLGVTVVHGNLVSQTFRCPGRIRLHTHATHVQVLRKMGCVDPTSHSDAHLPAGCLAACMVQAGIKPDEDPFLKCLVMAYRSYALKNVMVRTVLL
jgi:hypothetical protein